MNTLTTKSLLALVLGTGMVSSAWADDGQAEVGPAKAAKESAHFIDYLDRDTVLGGKFSTWLELASDYVFRGESE